MTLSLPLIVSLIVVAVLTAGGMAVRSVSRIWLRHWAERQLRGAAAAVTYLERPHRLLTAANVGVALTLLIAGLFLGAAERGAGVAWSTLAFAGFVMRDCGLGTGFADPAERRKIAGALCRAAWLGTKSGVSRFPVSLTASVIGNS